MNYTNVDLIPTDYAFQLTASMLLSDLKMDAL